MGIKSSDQRCIVFEYREASIVIRAETIGELIIVNVLWETWTSPLEESDCGPLKQFHQRSFDRTWRSSRNLRMMRYERTRTRHCVRAIRLSHLGQRRKLSRQLLQNFSSEFLCFAKKLLILHKKPVEFQ